MDTRLMTRTEVEDRCGLARSTIYRMMEEGSFPRPVRIGAKAVRWREDEINALIQSWTAARDE